MKSGKILSYFLGISLFLIMPFIYSFQLQDIEQSPRYLFLSIVSFIASPLLYLFLIKNKELKFNFHKVYYLVMGLFIMLVISLFNSLNFWDGFFEFTKILLISTLCFIFYLLFSADKKNSEIIIKCLVLSVFIFTGFTIYQLYPNIMAFITEGKIFTINYSVGSTLGNKNLYAEMLFFSLPLLIYSIINFTGFWRNISIASASITLISIILLQTLSTWLALIVALIITAPLIFYYRKTLFPYINYKKVFITSGILLVVFAIGVILLIKFDGHHRMENRIKALYSLTETNSEWTGDVQKNSFYERIIVWRNSVSMVKEYPLLGAGLGNWKIFAPLYGYGTADYMVSGHIRFVHPHNEFLLIAAESGIISLILFIAVLIYLYVYCFRNNEKNLNNEIIQNIIFISAISGIILISMVSFPISRFFPPLIFGLIFSVILTRIQFSNKNYIHGSFIKTLPFILILVSSYGIYIGNKRLSSDLRLTYALLEERKNNWTVMNRHLAKVDKKYFPLDVTATPLAWYQGFAEFYLGNLDNAFKFYIEAENVNPYHLNVLNDLGTCYNLKGDPQMAMKYYYRALSLQPEYGPTLINMAIIHFNSGKIDDAFYTILKYKGKFNDQSRKAINVILFTKATEFLSAEEKSILETKLEERDFMVNIQKEVKSNPESFEQILKKYL